MAFVHHTMLTAENLRGLPSKQLHTNVEPHYSPRSRAAPLCGVGGLVGVYSRPVIGGALFGPLSGFRYWQGFSGKSCPNFHPTAPESKNLLPLNQKGCV